ncbi:NADH-dependent dehydrogenase [Geomicrobium sp. JCM 19037]|nr:NADH-dependent dehydrogenase [Geomicrobium sp. JCM 19037]
MKIQIGIVGTGGIATDRHIPTFMQLHQKCDVSAVYDVDVEKAARVGEAVGANVYSSYEDMLEHVDAVCICTPNAFHADLAIAALDAGVHVFCEKPMAISSTDAARMNGAAKRSGCVLAIGFHYRFMHNVQVAKKQMASIGDPLVVSPCDAAAQSTRLGCVYEQIAPRRRQSH